MKYLIPIAIFIISVIAWTFRPIGIENFCEHAYPIPIQEYNTPSKPIGPDDPAEYNGGGSQYTYQGHGIPLAYEQRPMRPPNPSMVKFANGQCRPECCAFSPGRPANFSGTYTCDHGCVCWELPPDINPVMSAIHPGTV